MSHERNHEDMSTTENTAPREGVPERAMEFGPDAVQVTVAVLLELLEATAEVTSAAGTQEQDSALDVALKRLGAATSSALLPHVIDTVERNGGSGRELPKPLEYALAEQFDQPADLPGAQPRDLNDRLYLRWLAHRPIDVDEATVQRFHQRWVERRSQLTAE